MQKFVIDGYINLKENINIIYMNNDMGCDIHTHEFAELIFTTNGSSTHYINDVEYTAEKGDLIFVNYGQTHLFKASEDYCYYNILYVPEFFSQELVNSENIYDIFAISLFDEFNIGESKSCQQVSFYGDDFERISKLITAMHYEFAHKNQGYKSILNGYSRVLFTEILRKMMHGMQNKSVSEDIMLECIQYIDNNCYNKLSLQEIAAKTFYNPSYFSRLFKKSCGTSLTGYIKSKRISRAEQLLCSTDKSVDDIMLIVGYNDKKCFYRHFKEKLNETPSQFRKRCKKSLPKD